MDRKLPTSPDIESIVMSDGDGMEVIAKRTSPAVIGFPQSVAKRVLLVRRQQTNTGHEGQSFLKPWRCGTRIPPNRYPWENDEEEKRFRSWENHYNRACTKFATCELIAPIGHTRCPVEVEKIQAFHDQYTCSTTKLTLA
ncbi:hypothetical protein MYX65_10945 [Acidobacteria bacterium AH-259-L09]|nr:hypothetical protein [Acidobacteria bacterium AH-259-L09]